MKLIKLNIFIFLFLLINQVLIASNSELNKPKASIGFVKNVGQILNQNGGINREVYYSYEGEQLNVHLRKNGFSYQLVQTEYVQGKEPFEINQRREVKGYKTHRIEIDFEGANSNIQPMESEIGSGQIIYCDKVNAANNKQLNHYKKVLFKNIYNQVDIEFVIGKDKVGNPKFKYNIILHPGANSEQIRMRINGANSTEINEAEELAMTTSLGIVKEQIPLSYELEVDGSEGKSIQVKYKKLAKNLFGFSGINWVINKSVVIDPVAWVTYYGGSGVENVGGMVTDKDNNVYITGRTSSSSGIATVGSYQSVYNGGSQIDVFLAKFSSAGVLMWATYYGGILEDNVADIEIDVFNNILIAGYTQSTTGIVTGTAMQSTHIGGYDGFIARFSPSGGLLYGTYYGYSGNELLYGICSDKTGAIYATGSTNSIVTLTPGVHQQNNAGNYDVFIMKMTYSGALAFATYYGGTNSEYATELLLDNSKNIYLSGYSSSSTGIASLGAYKVTLDGTYDGFYAKFDSIGRRVFATYYGGTSNEYFYDMCWDVENKIIIGGYTSSNNGIALGTVFQTSYGGGTYDGVVLKVDTSGNPIWATYAGSTGNEFFIAIVSDPSSNIIVTGGTNSTSGIATADAVQSVFGGGSNDVYLIKFDKNGTRLWSTYYGGTDQDFGRELAIDLAGAIYVSGETFSPGGIATIGSHQTTLAGSSDGYLLKYIESIVNGPISNNSLSANQGLCVGSAAAIIVGSTPLGGNGTYTYEWLYSSTGSAGTFGIANGVNNAINYDPGSLTTNGYFKRVVKSGTFTDTSATHSITFGTALNAGFTINKGIQCLNSNVFVFSDTTTSTGGLTYSWDFGNGTYGSNQVEQVTYAAGTNNMYRVSLITSLSGSCGDTSYATVYTITNPVLKTINGKDTVLKGTTEVYNVTGTLGSSYHWLFSNGNGRSYTNTLNIKWTQIGDVQLKMIETNSGDCFGDTAIKNIYVKQPTSEEELFGSDLSIYPNPSDGIVYVEMDKIGKYSMEVYTLAGKIIYQDIVNKQVQINLGQEPNGFYLLVLTNEQGEIHHRKIQLIK